MEIPKHDLPWPRLFVFFTLGLGIYLAELAKPVARSLSVALTALQVILVGIATGLGIMGIWPPKLLRPQREAIDGEFFECRSIPILALMIISPIALIFVVVSLFVLNPSYSAEQKGNAVLFSLLLIFLLVPAAMLLGNRVIFAPAQVYFWGRLFSREILTGGPAAKMGPWAAIGCLVFPTRYRYFPFMWHLVSDPHAFLSASRRALQEA